MTAGFLLLVIGIVLLLANWIDDRQRLRHLITVRRRFSSVPPPNGHMRRRKPPWWLESPPRG